MHDSFYQGATAMNLFQMAVHYRIFQMWLVLAKIWP